MSAAPAYVSATNGYSRFKRPLAEPGRTIAGTITFLVAGGGVPRKLLGWLVCAFRLAPVAIGLGVLQVLCMPP